MMIDFLERNAEFIRSGGPRRLGPQAPRAQTVVVSCSCPDLTGLLTPALGLSPGEACLIRVAGAWGDQSAAEIIRSAACGLHISECEQIIVVVDRGCKYCPPNRGLVRDHLRDADIGRWIRRPGDELNLVSGPSSPEAGVRETVFALRSSALIPAGVPIQGFLLDLASGALDLVVSDEANASATPPEHSAGQADDPCPKVSPAVPELAIPELPLSSLPEITLPRLPHFDINVADNPSPPPAPKPFTYGSHNQDAGPIAFEKLQMPPPLQPLQNIEKQPAPNKLQPNTSHIDSTVKQRKRKKTDPVPMDFVRGVYSFHGQEYPIDSELLDSINNLRKIFLEEFSPAFRFDVAEQILTLAEAGQKQASLFKPIVTSVLKLDQKRTGLASDLAKMKEWIPRLERDVALAIIIELLR